MVGNKMENYYNESNSESDAPPVTSKVSYVSYSQQLEEYINKYKTRPPDIKFWPYGPYWPRVYDTEILPTPRHITTCPNEPEPLATNDSDDEGKLFRK